MDNAPARRFTLPISRYRFARSNLPLLLVKSLGFPDKLKAWTREDQGGLASLWMDGNTPHLPHLRFHCETATFSGTFLEWA